MVNRVLDKFTSRAIIVRLSGHAQVSDRIAVREMARQISSQIGSSIELEESGDESIAGSASEVDRDNFLPPASQILSLVARLPTLPRPMQMLKPKASTSNAPRMNCEAMPLRFQLKAFDTLS